MCKYCDRRYLAADHPEAERVRRDGHSVGRPLPPEAARALTAMPRSIFAYVRAYSWRDQVTILALTLISLPFFYLWVDLPKRIVATTRWAAGPGLRTFFGVSMSRLDYLWLLCLLFLALVIINGVFKYIINVYKGIVGERESPPIAI